MFCIRLCFFTANYLGSADNPVAINAYPASLTQQFDQQYGPLDTIISRKNPLKSDKRALEHGHPFTGLELGAHLEMKSCRSVLAGEDRLNYLIRNYCGFDAEANQTHCAARRANRRCALSPAVGPNEQISRKQYLDRIYPTILFPLPCFDPRKINLETLPLQVLLGN